MKLQVQLILILSMALLAICPVYGQFELVSYSSEPVTCNGDSDGSIMIAISGGTPPYFYSYSGPAGSSDFTTNGLSHTFTGIKAGFYAISVLDDNFQYVSSSIIVSQPALLTVNILPDPANICPGSDRSLSGNPAGGNGGYIHQWSGTGAAYLNGTDIPGPVFNSAVIGNYGLTYRVEDQKGCEADGSISIEVYESLTAGFSSTDVTCHSGNNGTVTVTGAFGGSGNYEYSADGSAWQSSNILAGLAAGSYNIYIRDADYPGDCQALIGTAVIGQPGLLVADIGHDDATCHGSANGSINITSPTGGSGLYEYRVSGSGWQEPGLFEGLLAGNYVVEIRDASDISCVVELDDSYTLSEPAPITADIDHVDVSCNGASDGSITITTGFNGFSGYDYRISGFGWQPDALFEGLSAGDYVVEVRSSDDPACVVEIDGAYTVSEPDELTAVIDHSDVTGCHGDANGWIEINASGSWAELTGNYEYSINGGTSWSSNNLFTGLSAGTYSIYVRDADNPGCFRLIDDNFIIGQPDPINAGIEWDPVSCFGGSDGEIRFVNVLGGTPPYQYSINGGTTWIYVNTVFSGLPAGFYDLRIRNGNAPHCPTVINSSFEMEQAPELVISNVVNDNVDCHGSFTGSITVTASGGTGTIYYSVNGVDYLDNGGLFSGLGAGIYPVSVRDDNDCITLWGDVEITEPAPLYGEADINDVACNGDTNGEITVINVSGGTLGNYEYRLDSGPWVTGNFFGGLSPGSYTVWIRDADVPGCMTEVDGSPLTVSEPPVLEILTDLTHVDCFGSATGSVEVSATGGNGGYQYNIDGGAWQPGNVFGSLTAGSYMMGVRDMTGCTAYQPVTLTEAPELVISNVVHDNADCHGSLTGSITVTASGGTGNIYYSVNGVDYLANGGLFSGLGAGIYPVSVRDDNDCITLWGDVEITEPAPLYGEADINDVACNGDTNGEITVINVSGGTIGNYEYRLDSGPWVTGNFFGGLSPGSYTVWIRDADVPGCMTEVDGSPLTVSEPPLLEILTDLTHVDCFGSATGSVEVSATGGNGGYQYNIDGGVWQPGNVFGSLTAGSYMMGVRDMTGCTAYQPVTILQNVDLVFIEVISDNESCFGAENGTINVILSGGTPPYRYSIDGGTSYQDDPLFTDLLPGYYQVVVEDAYGCYRSFFDEFGVNIFIDAAAEIVINSANVTDISCHGASDGVIAVNASGGAGGLMYSLDGAAWQPGGTFTGLDAGTYTVWVRDSKLCIVTTVLTVSEPDELLLNAWHDNIDCYGAFNGVVYASASGGVSPYIYRLYNASDGTEAAPAQVSADPVSFAGLDEGTYYVVVHDDSGCSSGVGSDLIVTQPPEIVISLVTSENISCHGEVDGTITIDAAGGAGTLLYSTDGGIDFYDNGGNFAGMPAGTYNIIVRDSDGCEITYPLPVEITEPDMIELATLDITPATCFGSLNGSITATGTGGTGTLEYSLDNDSYQPGGFFGGLSGGSYTLYIRDGSGCVRVFGVLVPQPDQLILTAEVLNTACFGLPGDPGIRAMATGGTAPYTIALYLDGLEQASFTGVAEGDWVLFEPVVEEMTGYMVVVEDDAGCPPVNSGLLSTEIPDVLSVASFDHTGNTCFGEEEGTIEAEAAGGTQPYIYRLFDDGGVQVREIETAGAALFDALPAGTYNVSISDFNGCGPVTTGDIVISQPAEIVIDDLSVTDVSCHGAGDGSIVIAASGGTGDLYYSINGGTDFHLSGNFPGLSGGSYDIVISDDAGCIIPEGIHVIAEPDELEFSSVQVNNIIIGSGNEYGSVVVEAEGGTPPYEYSIDGGLSWQGDNTFDNLAEGDYDIIARDANGCTVEVSLTIEEIIGIDVTITATPPSCPGDDDGTIVLTADLGTEPYQYSVDGGATFQPSGSFGELNAGVYEIVVRDASGYFYQQTLVLSDPDPLVASATVTPAFCSSSGPPGLYGGVELTVTGGTGTYSYLWSGGETTKDIGNIRSGEYKVVFTDQNDCKDSLDVVVGYDNLMEVSLPPDTTICPDESIQLNTSVSQSGLSASYSWSASAGETPAPVASPTVSPQSATQYSVVVTDVNGCYDEAAIIVSLHERQGIFIGNDTILLHGTTIDLVATGGEFVSYEWAPSTGLSEISGPETTAFVTGEIIYYLFAETVQGCTEYDSIHIKIVFPVSPVSGFTPNGDGVNDYFDILHAEDYPNMEVEVFNRAGQRIFYSRGYSPDRRWDGRFNGRELPVGTYYFVITLNDVFGTKPLTGPITIVR